MKHEYHNPVLVINLSICFRITRLACVQLFCEVITLYLLLVTTVGIPTEGEIKLILGQT